MWNSNWTELRNILSSLIYQSDDIKRIVRDIELDPGEIRFNGKAQDSWQDVLEQSQAQGKFSQLKELLHKKYPGHVQLQAAILKCEKDIQQQIDAFKDTLKVSTSSLPDTGPELFGREQELAMLDAAWDDPKIRIVTLIAWGGVGKSSLMNKWLRDMGDENYRGALRVFGWSFYSQGAAEGKQASADRFFEEALSFFGDPDPEAGDPTAKARRLAGLIRAQKSLLLLDGLEPLQYPPKLKEQNGLLKDKALCRLLKDLASQNPGLCVISSRLAVNDLRTFFASSVQDIELNRLSEKAGVTLLKNLGAKGAEDDVKHAVNDFRGHALALTLLGSYLKVVHGGDIRKRDLIPQLREEEQFGGHARRVMESYEHWFRSTERKSNSVSTLIRKFIPPKKRGYACPELNLLYIMGLFDRPADMAAIEALTAPPVIKGLTEELQNLSHKEWQETISHLQDLRLLARPELPERERKAIDCHPLVREHFGAKLKQEQPEAWKAAHSRLYEYYKALPEKELPNTLEKMEPLFAAVSHGCLAGRHQEALDEVYWTRIKRGDEHYTTTKLGAFGADLAAVANFFEEVWSRPATGLEDMWKAAVLNWAGFGLRALGRLREAAQPMQAGLELRVQQENWKEAAKDAGNLSELWLSVGYVGRAVKAARQSVDFADRSGDGFWKYASRTTLADALHQAAEIPPGPPLEKGGNTFPLSSQSLGDEFQEAEALFREAEEMQKEEQPDYPYLYSLQGFRYCDLLLSLGRVQEVRQRAAQTLEWAEQYLGLLTRALDRLSLGRAALLQAQQEQDLAALENPTELPELREAAERLEQAVTGLRDAGQQDDLPRGLLARAALRRVVGNFEKAWSDLNEVYDIASRGEMRLHLTDYHLEAARVINEESRMNNEQLQAVKLREHLEAAAALIEATGYHRRDAELAELRVLREQG